MSWYIVTIIACIFLVCRLWVRWRLLKRLYLDDLFVMVAALCLIGDLVIQHYMFNLGMYCLSLLPPLSKSTCMQSDPCERDLTVDFL